MIRLLTLALALVLSACGGSATPAPDCVAAFDECSMAPEALVLGDRCYAYVPVTGKPERFADVTCPEAVK